jgi:hypothetical protein
VLAAGIVIGAGTSAPGTSSGRQDDPQSDGHRAAEAARQEMTMTTRTRREFLREAAAGSAATFLAPHRSPFAMSHASPAPPWASQIGLELYTVRDLLASDYEGTLAKIAAIGYTEVEPTSYNDLAPREFRALLDRAGQCRGVGRLARGGARVVPEPEGDARSELNQAAEALVIGCAGLE